MKLKRSLYAIPGCIGPGHILYVPLGFKTISLEKAEA